MEPACCVTGVKTVDYKIRAEISFLGDKLQQWTAAKLRCANFPSKVRNVSHLAEIQTWNMGKEITGKTEALTSCHFTFIEVIFINGPLEINKDLWITTRSGSLLNGFSITHFKFILSWNMDWTYFGLFPQLSTKKCNTVVELHSFLLSSNTENTDSGKSQDKTTEGHKFLIKMNLSQNILSCAFHGR